MPDATGSKENRLLQYAVLAAILLLAAIFTKTFIDAVNAPEYTGFVTVKPIAGRTVLTSKGNVMTTFANTGRVGVTVIVDRATAKTTHGACTGVRIYAGAGSEPAEGEIHVPKDGKFRLTAKCREGTPNSYYRLKVVIPYKVDETDVTTTVTEIGEIQGRYGA